MFQHLRSCLKFLQSPQKSHSSSTSSYKIIKLFPLQTVHFFAPMWFAGNRSSNERSDRRVSFKLYCAWCAKEHESHASAHERRRLGGLSLQKSHFTLDFNLIDCGPRLSEKIDLFMSHSKLMIQSFWRNTLRDACMPVSHSSQVTDQLGSENAKFVNTADNSRVFQNFSFYENLSTFSSTQRSIRILRSFTEGNYTSHWQYSLII